jgi:hypothetical protein
VLPEPGTSARAANKLQADPEFNTAFLMSIFLWQLLSS